MGLMDELEKAADEFSDAVNGLADKAKAKYDEKMTPEKKAELKDKFDKGMQTADERLTEVAETVGKEIKVFVNGSKSGGDNK